MLYLTCKMGHYATFFVNFLILVSGNHWSIESSIMCCFERDGEDMNLNIYMNVNGI